MQVSITFPDLSHVPNDLAVMLRDVDANRTVNMRTSRNYVFTSGDSGAVRHLRIEVKPRGTQAAMLTSVSALPTTEGMQVVYALSAPGQVGIEVLNIAGRTVATVPAGYQEAGTHTALWSCRSATGTKVPRGQYLLKLQCQADDGTQTSRIVLGSVR